MDMQCYFFSIETKNGATHSARSSAIWTRHQINHKSPHGDALVCNPERSMIILSKKVAATAKHLSSILRIYSNSCAFEFHARYYAR